ncbi:MAG: VirB3 family type IV secretion system protein [Bryobacteraceae bacterium]|jgi:type IV secretory pathway TrbD component
MTNPSFSDKTKLNQPNLHRVSKSVNKPLTIWGAERRLFFLALIMGAATFNFFASLLSGLLMFASLYAFARWATATDSQILRILLNSSKFRKLYDPGKREAFGFTMVRTLQEAIHG